MEKKDVKIQGKKNEVVKDLDNKMNAKYGENSTRKMKSSLESQNKKLNTELETVIKEFNFALKKINKKVEDKSSKKELEDAINEQKSNFKLLVKKINEALGELKKNIDSKKKEIDANNEKLERYKAKLNEEELIRQTEELKEFFENEKDKLKSMIELIGEQNQEEIENIKEEQEEFKGIEQARVSRLKEEQKNFFEAQQLEIDNIKEENENYKADLEEKYDNLLQEYENFSKKFTANDLKRVKKLEDELSKIQQGELINIRQEYRNYAENLKEVAEGKMENIKEFQKEIIALKEKQQDIEKKYENKNGDENKKLITGIKLQTENKIEQLKQAYLNLQENTKEQIIKLKEQNKAQEVTIKEMQLKNVKLQSKIEKLSADLKESNDREFLTEEQVRKIVENTIKKAFSTMFNSAIEEKMPTKEVAKENKQANIQKQNTRVQERKSESAKEIEQSASEKQKDRRKMINETNEGSTINRVTIGQNDKNLRARRTPVTSLGGKNIEKTVKDKIYEPIQIKQVAKNIVADDANSEIIKPKQNLSQKQLIGFFDTDDEDIY